jgi:hypothetical protein
LKESAQHPLTDADEPNGAATGFAGLFTSVTNNLPRRGDLAASFPGNAFLIMHPHEVAIGASTVTLHSRAPQQSSA